MLVLAHRGVHYRGLSENTIEAFEEGIRQGADGIEFDLRSSKDGELVIVHDANLHRVAGDAHRVGELTAGELAEIPLRQGGKIPTLHDVTSRIHAPALLDIEVKHPDALESLIVKLKTSAALRERTIVSSFNTHVIAGIRRDVSDVRTLLLMKRWPLPLHGRTFWQKVGSIAPWGVGLPLALLTTKRVRFLRARIHARVAGWDSRGAIREAQKARKLGVDAAIVKHVREARIPIS